MKASVLIALLAIGAGLALSNRTTTIRHGGSTAMVTQSDSFFGMRKSVEQWPGHLHIRQSNGGNSATIIQNGTRIMGFDDDRDLGPVRS